MAISYHPTVLYHASLERMEAARRAFDSRDYVLSAYLSGLAVECVVQAFAMRNGAVHDARHHLGLWLAKCPTTLNDRIRQDAADEWSRMLALWDNGLRYLSFEGLLGYFRKKGATRGISGGPPAVVREITRQMTQSADIICGIGAAIWKDSTKKS